MFFSFVFKNFKINVKFPAYSIVLGGEGFLGTYFKNM
jgi:hypothetical protein